MRPPKIRQYPKSVIIKDEEYKIRFVRKLGPKTFGECDPETREIRIRFGQGREETLKTMIHELFHAIEFEYDLKIKHRLIHNLEEPLFLFLLSNF